jgi:hypothetical protein
MTRGFVGTIDFPVPCASSVREGFTENGSSEMLQAAIISQVTRGFVGESDFRTACASDVREGFTENGSSEKLRAAIIERLRRGNRIIRQV